MSATFKMCYEHFHSAKPANADLPRGVSQTENMHWPNDHSMVYVNFIGTHDTRRDDLD